MSISRPLGVATIVAIAVLMTTNAVAGNPDKGRGSGPVIYVTSQGQFYDSIVLTDLPMRGPFQQLSMGQFGLETEFGPGNVGYLGGRWWLDANANGYMDEEDAFFMCPLLGPGRGTP